VVKFYEHKWLVIAIQVVTIFFISVTQIDMVLKLMLLFGYVMLFRQKRWHKHLLIMLLMTIILSIATTGFTFNI